MAKEYSFTIQTHNYGEIDFSYTGDSDKCLILFIIGNNINAIDFPAVLLLGKIADSWSVFGAAWDSPIAGRSRIYLG